MTEPPGRRSLDMVGIAHLDAAWLWPWTEGYAEVRATVRSALDRLDEDPEFLFTCDSVAYYAWIEENDPGAVRADACPHRRGPLGARRRLVGGARLQRAERRIARPAGPATASDTSSSDSGARRGWA